MKKVVDLDGKVRYWEKKCRGLIQLSFSPNEDRLQFVNSKSRITSLGTAHYDCIIRVEEKDIAPNAPSCQFDPSNVETIDFADVLPEIPPNDDHGLELRLRGVTPPPNSPFTSAETSTPSTRWSITRVNEQSIPKKAMGDLVAETTKRLHDTVFTDVDEGLSYDCIVS